MPYHLCTLQGKKYKFHLIPSAILHSHVQCVVGNGVVVHLKSMLQELDTLTKMDVDYKG
ncbi:hypothetical protein EON63_05435 [archaeon]|nr:MAG: hypothetical protein EON63_05435 [archaeon]